MDDIDSDKLHFYLSANFYFFDEILFSSLVKMPDIEDLKQLKKQHSKQDIEKLYNHFHLSALCEDPWIQRELAPKILGAWRQFFEKKVPHKQICIEIIDYNFETILYLYEVTNVNDESS